MIFYSIVIFSGHFFLCLFFFFAKGDTLLDSSGMIVSSYDHTISNFSSWPVAILSSKGHVSCLMVSCTASFTMLCRRGQRWLCDISFVMIGFFTVILLSIPKICKRIERLVRPLQLQSDLWFQADVLDFPDGFSRCNNSGYCLGWSSNDYYSETRFNDNRDKIFEMFHYFTNRLESLCNHTNFKNSRWTMRQGFQTR